MKLTPQFPAWHTEDCLVCDGHGEISDYGPLGDDFYGAKECPECSGSGKLWVSPKGRIADYPGGPFRGSIPEAPK